jgi:hypothetical protein
VDGETGILRSISSKRISGLERKDNFLFHLLKLFSNIFEKLYLTIVIFRKVERVKSYDGLKKYDKDGLKSQNIDF